MIFADHILVEKKMADLPCATTTQGETDGMVHVSRSTVGATVSKHLGGREKWGAVGGEHDFFMTTIWLG